MSGLVEVARYIKLPRVQNGTKPKQHKIVGPRLANCRSTLVHSKKSPPCCTISKLTICHRGPTENQPYASRILLRYAPNQKDLRIYRFPIICQPYHQFPAVTQTTNDGLRNCATLVRPHCTSQLFLKRMFISIGNLQVQLLPY